MQGSLIEPTACRHCQFKFQASLVSLGVVVQVGINEMPGSLSPWHRGTAKPLQSKSHSGWSEEEKHGHTKAHAQKA